MDAFYAPFPTTLGAADQAIDPLNLEETVATDELYTGTGQKPESENRHSTSQKTPAPQDHVTIDIV